MTCKHRIMDKCKKDNKPCIFSEECYEPEEHKPMTNADRIRAMTNEELAGFLLAQDYLCQTHRACVTCPKNTKDGCLSLLEWLQQPVEESE